MNDQNLKSVYIRLEVTAAQVDIDRAKKSLSEKLNLSVKGLMVNCSETQLNDRAIEMLCALTNVARKDGKRLALCSLSPQANNAIQNSQSRQLLDVFGEKLKPQTPKKQTTKGKTNRWIAITVIPVLVALPLIVAVDYLLNNFYSPSQSVVVKTFETNAKEPFVIFGTVDSIQSGKRRPDTGAVVIAWVNDSKENSVGIQSRPNAHITYADSRGRFRLPIESSEDTKHLTVRISILSEALDAKSPTADPYEPANLRPNEYHATRQTQTYDYVIEAGKPVRLNLLFF